ncbi:hypothetical protein [Candidatus Bathycorpusculum sp.]|jgi:hypothetical protein|uniref:hypothetical protein n=1 Tax=Candidatus Bathycorpusculum sp. TaxID=2994959 RepID=UPI002830093B|nr:hypothetical protein [Candidatus Termitimicrobium sp.]
MKKIFNVFIFSLLACTLVFAGIACIDVVQAASKPSVPQFSLKFVSHPYDVDPTYTTNPYTGETIINYPGYHVKNKSIEVTIKNQPFSPYKTSDNNYVALCYNISVKPHYSDDWAYYPRMYSQIPLTASKGDYTITAFGSDIRLFEEGNEIKSESQYSFNINLPDSGQLDFRVEALIGYYTSARDYLPVPGGPYYTYTFFGESSGWSNIQTITLSAEPTATNTPPPSSTTAIGASQNSTTPIDQPDTPSDSLFDLSWEQTTIILLTTIIVVLVVALVLSQRRVAKQSMHSPSSSVPHNIQTILLCLN